MMYKAISAAAHAQPATYVTSAVYAMLVVACLIEVIRLVRMAHLMAKNKIDAKEKAAFNAIVADVIVLILLGVRSCILCSRVSGSVSVPVTELFYVVPVVIYIYALRITSKYIWEEIICARYRIARKERTVK